MRSSRYTLAHISLCLYGLPKGAAEFLCRSYAFSNTVEHVAQSPRLALNLDGMRKKNCNEYN
jgi:hypothetical protein